MKGPACRQKYSFGDVPAKALDAEVKYLTVMVFERSGKTIIQPLVTNHETQSIQELLQNNTLEVWLSNGEADPAQFDVAILKYKQQMQPPATCTKMKNRACLKNNFDAIVSCEQCPLSDCGAED